MWSGHKKSRPRRDGFQFPRYHPSFPRPAHCLKYLQRALNAKLFVHSRYRSRPARPTHAIALQPRRSGASSAFRAPDFHQPSVLYAAFPAYYSPSPRFNCRVCYHPPESLSMKAQSLTGQIWASAIPKPVILPTEPAPHSTPVRHPGTPGSLCAPGHGPSSVNRQRRWGTGKQREDAMAS